MGETWLADFRTSLLIGLGKDGFDVSILMLLIPEGPAGFVSTVTVLTRLAGTVLGTVLEGREGVGFVSAGLGLDSEFCAFLVSMVTLVKGVEMPGVWVGILGVA